MMDSSRLGWLCFVTGAVEHVLEASSKSHLKRRQSRRIGGLAGGGRGGVVVCAGYDTHFHSHSLCGNINEKTSKYFSPPLFLALLLHSLSPTHTHTHTLGPLWFVLFYFTNLYDPSTRDQYD